MNKLQLQNIAWTSTSNSWPNSETLCSKSEQKLNFKTKLHLPNLHQTVINTFLIINMSNSNNLNKFWVVIFTCQDHINQVNGTMAGSVGVGGISTDCQLTRTFFTYSHFISNITKFFFSVTHHNDFLTSISPLPCNKSTDGVLRRHCYSGLGKEGRRGRT